MVVCCSAVSLLNKTYCKVIILDFVGTTAGTLPKCGNGGVSDAVTSELRDRQSSHPVKNPASVLWQVFRGVARCCLPRFQGQPQHLKYQNRIKKNSTTTPLHPLTVQYSCYNRVTDIATNKNKQTNNKHCGQKQYLFCNCRASCLHLLF